METCGKSAMRAASQPSERESTSVDNASETAINQKKQMMMMMI